MWKISSSQFSISKQQNKYQNIDTFHTYEFNPPQMTKRNIKSPYSLDRFLCGLKRYCSFVNKPKKINSCRIIQKQITPPGLYEQKKIFLGFWSVTLFLPYAYSFFSPNLFGISAWNSFGTFYWLSATWAPPGQ